MARSMSHDDALAHFGVKGMRWGIRNNESKSTIRSRYSQLKAKPTENLSLTTAKGVKVDLLEDRVAPLAAAVGSVSSRFRNLINSSRSFRVSVDGKEVGNVTIREKSKD